MNFGTHEWQERVRVNYFKDLDLKMSCNEQSLRTIQVAPPVKALIEMTQHRQDRGRIRILFSIATFNSLGYEAGRLGGTVFLASGESDFPGPSLLTPEDCVLYPTDCL